ncbi:MAG TPA: NUDIX domain-containing protein [Candidatus Saccharimonadales bacterium]|nr:NUDIX domain-containing protein [Candidatus Saccharimonadales bacterium]
MKQSNYPEAIVGGYIRNRKGQILFVSSYKWKGMWSIPGGHVELGERIVDALRREIKEEVGIEVTVTRLLNVQSAIYPKHFVRKVHFIFFNYLCEAKADKVKIDKDEVQSYKWVTPEETRRMKMNVYTRNTMKLLLMKGTYEHSIPTEMEKRLLNE